MDSKYNDFLKSIFDFFNNIAKSINAPFNTGIVTSAIYLLIWAGIFIVVFYFARSISGEQETSEHKKWKITVLWVIAAILILAAAFFFMVEIAYGYDGSDDTPAAFEFFARLYSMLYMFFNTLLRNFGGGGVAAIAVYLIFFVFLYLALKLIITIFMCSNQYGSIKFKLLKHNAMPVCHCKEAFQIFPTILIYFLPAIFMYSVLQILIVRNDDFFVGIFLIFFISFDLTAVIYVLFFKIKHKADYLSLDNHIYDVTVFKGTYVRFGNKKATAKPRINVNEIIRKQEREKLFKEMTTCVNHMCENYGLEADSDESGSKRCTLCGRRKYTAKVFTGMMTCINRDCEQFGYELKNDIEACNLCGGKIGQIALKFNPGFVKPAIIMAIASCVIDIIIILTMYDSGVKMFLIPDQFSPLLSIVNFSMFTLYVTGIVMAWISKSKKALAISAVSLPIVALILRLIVS